jgi:hypothetical protein
MGKNTRKDKTKETGCKTKKKKRRQQENKLITIKNTRM